MSEIFSSRLNLPRYVMKDFENIFLESLNKKLSMGRKLETLVSVCIYVSCVQNNYTKTMKSLIKNTDISMQEFNLCLKRQELNLNITNVNKLDLLEKYMNLLKFDFKSREHALRLYEKNKNNRRLYSINPKSLIASILYVTSIDLNLGISQRQIAHTMDVFETTIRRWYQKIE